MSDCRVGDWIQTATGGKFWPLDPRPEEVSIDDIAHALSMQCRYGGHCNAFYSVAQHSVFVMAQCGSEDPEVQLWALLHDAAEAYVADVPRPLKRFLVGYKDAEERVMAAVCDRFGLPREMPACVRAADEAMLAAEALQLMRPVHPDWYSGWLNTRRPAEVGLIVPQSPEVAREQFLGCFLSVGRRRVRSSVPDNKAGGNDGGDGEKHP